MKRQNIIIISSFDYVVLWYNIYKPVADPGFGVRVGGLFWGHFEVFSPILDILGGHMSGPPESAYKP